MQTQAYDGNPRSITIDDRTRQLLQREIDLIYDLAGDLNLYLCLRKDGRDPEHARRIIRGLTDCMALQDQLGWDDAAGERTLTFTRPVWRALQAIRARSADWRRDLTRANGSHQAYAERMREWGMSEDEVAAELRDHRRQRAEDLELASAVITSCDRLMVA